MWLLEYIGSIFLSLLPPRYRADVKLQGPAIASAGIEGFLAVSMVLGRLILVANRANSVPEKDATELFLKYGGAYVSTRAASGLVDFWLSPFNLICYYFVFEAVVRLFAALEGTHIIGTLPLYAVSAVHGLIDKAAYQKYVGELVADKVVRGDEKNRGYDLKVYSCRPKLEWNRYITIEFEGEFYECFDEELNEEPGPSPRRFVYYLRKSPPGRLVVVVKPYK